MAVCTACGSSVPDDIRFCIECGNRMGQAEQSPVQQPQAVQPPVQQAQFAPPPVQQPQFAPPPQGMSAAQPVQQNIANAVPPSDNRSSVMGTFGYIGSMILFAFPIVGLFFFIGWSFSKKVNINLRNFARAYFIFWIIGVVLIILSMVYSAVLLSTLTDGQFSSWAELFRFLQQSTN